MQKRRNTSALPAITPMPPEPKPTGRLSAEELQIELVNCRRLLAAERKRNAVLTGCLGRYITLLESVCADQRAAFQELGKPLVPNALQKGGKQ